MKQGYPAISILIPSIRPSLLEGVYKSILESCYQSWELIITSPYDLPGELKQYKNITYVKTYSSPIRARQIGLMYAQGDYICYAADDVLFFPGSLDIAYGHVENADYKTVVAGKYCEGDPNSTLMRANDYWHLNYHMQLRDIMTRIGKDYLLVNTGLISRKFMREIGGFDCQFEACAIACVDLSIRMQNDGATMILQNEPIFHSTWTAGQAGDHKPIHDAQTLHDEPLLYALYDGRGNGPAGRIKIDLDNWEKYPDRWERRFGK